MKKSYVIVSSLVIVAVLAIIYFSVKINIQNNGVELKNLVVAQQKVCKANFDNMFKVISQVAEVSEQNMNKSKEAFKEIYPELIKGRYDGEKGSSLMKWVTESNPQFDLKETSKLYSKLAEVIEEKRNEFFVEQEKLIDYQNNHKNLIMKFPGKLFLDLKDTVGITIITSAKTDAVYKSGKEDDIKLFDKK